MCYNIEVKKRRKKVVIDLRPTVFGSLLLMAVAVAFGFRPYGNIAPAVASVVTASSNSYSATSPHWPFINVSDFARPARAIGNTTIRNQAFAWLAAHLDSMETSMDNTTQQNADTVSTYLHTLNPTLKTYGYDYDLTMCQQAHCNQADPTPNPYYANLPEDEFLHFSEDTQLQFKDLNGNVVGSANITGCPDPQPVTSACRVQIFIWTQKRWVSNINNTTWRQNTADRLVQELQTNSIGGQNIVDGLFLDEHGPGFTVQLGIGYQTIIVSGGGIKEYASLRPDTNAWPNHAAIDTAYAAHIDAWLNYLQGRLAAVGKFARINTAEYFTDSLALSNAISMKGVMTEHANKPDSNAMIRADRYQAALDDIKQITDAGGQVDFTGTPCATPPAGYTAGNYPTAADRYKMWSFASYYLAKEAVGDPGMVWFDPNLCINPSAPNPLDFETTEWLGAYEQNVGLPTSPRTVAAQGSLACDGVGYKIFSRPYQNALVLVRVKDGFICNDYSDATAVTYTLPQPMQLLHPDGSRGATVSSVSIRNGEAVIMMTPPDTTPPAPVSNLQAL